MYARIYLDESEILTLPRYQHNLLTVYQPVAPNEKDKTDRYEIHDILHYGEFGDVYKARSLRTRQFVHLHTEIFEPPESHQHFKYLTEFFIGLMSSTDDRIKRRFPTCLLCGKDENFKYLVTNNLGRSVVDVRRYHFKKNFGKQDAIQIVCQMYFGIEFLHRLGYVHGDLSTKSYCFGVDDAEKNVYLYLFGRLRKHIVDGKVVNERSGTVYYNGNNNIFCPRTAHKRQDFCRRDDLESWLYICADIYLDSNPPWRAKKGFKCQLEDQETLQLKEMFFQGGKKLQNEFFEETPKEFKALIGVIDGLTFTEEPPYAQFRDILLALRQKTGVNKAPKWLGHSKTNVYRPPRRPIVKSKKKVSKKKAEEDEEEENEDTEEENKRKKKKKTKAKKKISRETTTRDDEEEETTYVNMRRRATVEEDEPGPAKQRKKGLKKQPSRDDISKSSTSNLSSMLSELNGGRQISKRSDLKDCDDVLDELKQTPVSTHKDDE